jgi:adenylate kinase family enzyme
MYNNGINLRQHIEFTKVRGKSRKVNKGDSQMKKIMVIGPGGSGKSTFSRELGEILKIPIYHLDALHWKPGWIPTPDDEWDEFQRELVKKDQWIIDGNYGRTLDIRMSEADTIIFFDLPRWINIYRVIKRRIMYHGRTRPDLKEGCPERLGWDFIKWIWNYKRDKKPNIIKKLKKHSLQKKIIIFKTHLEVRKLIENIKNEEKIVSNPGDGENNF